MDPPHIARLKMALNSGSGSHASRQTMEQIAGLPPRRVMNEQDTRWALDRGNGPMLTNVASQSDLTETSMTEMLHRKDKPIDKFA